MPSRGTFPHPSRALVLHATLPVVAITFLAGGALARVVGAGAAGAALGDRIWLLGLLVTGSPVVIATLVQVVRGRFATDLVAMLAIVGAVLAREPFAGLVIVLMRSGGQALDRYAEGRASRAVRDLEAASPRTAHRLLGAKGGKEIGSHLLGPVGSRLDHSTGGDRSDVDVWAHDQQLVIALRRGELHIRILTSLDAPRERDRRQERQGYTAHTPPLPED